MPIMVEQVGESASSPVQACLGTLASMRLLPPLGLEVAAARGVAALSRRLGAGGGTTIPGKLLAELDPGAIDRLAARLRTADCVVVSATNGKTTTTAMAAEILRPLHRLAHNAAGANLVSGVASALLAADDADLGLFEVDEGRAAGAAAAAAAASALPRQPLPRPARPVRRARAGGRALARRRRRAACGRRGSSSTPTTRSSPRSARRRRAASRSASTTRAWPARRSSTRPTRSTASRCGTPLDYAAAYVGHLGDFRCPNGHHEPAAAGGRRARHRALQGLERAAFLLVTPEGQRRVELGLPGLYNVYNALAAAALARAARRVARRDRRRARALLRRVRAVRADRRSATSGSSCS